MAMQTYQKTGATIADAPFCPTCERPMRIKEAVCTSRAVEISYHCKTCEAQAKQSSDDRQG